MVKRKCITQSKTNGNEAIDDHRENEENSEYKHGSQRASAPVLKKRLIVNDKVPDQETVETKQLPSVTQEAQVDNAKELTTCTESKETTVQALPQINVPVDVSEIVQDPKSTEKSKSDTSATTSQENLPTSETKKLFLEAIQIEFSRKSSSASLMNNEKRDRIKKWIKLKQEYGVLVASIRSSGKTTDIQKSQKEELMKQIKLQNASNRWYKKKYYLAIIDGKETLLSGTDNTRVGTIEDSYEDLKKVHEANLHAKDSQLIRCVKEIYGNSYTQQIVRLYIQFCKKTPTALETRTDMAIEEVEKVETQQLPIDTQEPTVDNSKELKLSPSEAPDQETVETKQLPSDTREAQLDNSKELTTCTESKETTVQALPQINVPVDVSEIVQDPKSTEKSKSDTSATTSQENLPTSETKKLFLEAIQIEFSRKSSSASLMNNEKRDRIKKWIKLKQEYGVLVASIRSSGKTTDIQKSQKEELMKQIKLQNASNRWYKKKYYLAIIDGKETLLSGTDNTRVGTIEDSYEDLKKVHEANLHAKDSQLIRCVKEIYGNSYTQQIVRLYIQFCKKTPTALETRTDMAIEEVEKVETQQLPIDTQEPTVDNSKELKLSPSEAPDQETVETQHVGLAMKPEHVEV